MKVGGKIILMGVERENSLLMSRIISMCNSESWSSFFFFSDRVLKMGRRLTLGIGDNREHCFYIPVGYHLIRQYIDNGFELEELVMYLCFLTVSLHTQYIIIYDRIASYTYTCFYL